ncbi:hypothetical protein [Sporosarcina highlanderae]|uniref:Phage protein n=1 Tax=Sporosarcina highlanderae TaxID=3035916 RepID=A0ABT8JUL3_9BACL|nr:hypothetical protein [Sporosarcina highlanderae]MDN4608637.1 hypothetical protein [Sporosarcina highlanderae]
MEVFEVKKAIAQSVAKLTVTAAICTVDCYGVPASITVALQDDLRELNKLDSSPLVEAAQDMVKIAIRHSIEPTTETYDEARIARDKLGDLLIYSKVVR